MEVLQHLSLLGFKAEDKVTGFKGTVTSVCFDLYGCIQAALNPGKGADGKLGESHWFDINRLEITEKEPVMQPPNFVAGPIAKGEHGPAEKPLMNKS